MEGPPPTEKPTITFVLEGETLSLRVIAIRPASGQQGDEGRPANFHVHIRARKRNRDVWLSVIQNARANNPAMELWRCPRRSQLFVRMWGRRTPDTPNMGWHAKYPIDAMVRLRILPWGDGSGAVLRTTSDAGRPDWAPPGIGMEIRIERFD